MDGVAFCRELVDRCGVVAIPSSVFYDDKASGRNLVRWMFSKRLDVLGEAISRLERLQ
jgi:N-succinyldiaminopimelate aminotransferase